VLDGEGGYIGATWQMRLNHPRVAVMSNYSDHLSVTMTMTMITRHSAGQSVVSTFQ